MARSVRFWRSLGDRMVCSACGASSWSISRMNYESRGRATCDECGARVVYYKRSRSQPNAAAGAVEPDSLMHLEDYIGESSNDWLAETAEGSR
jgi:DNA-directed RNA polymerase subunit RPC12/RpoP